MIELNEEETQLLSKALATKVLNAKFIKKSELLDCLSESERSIVTENLENSRTLSWRAANVTLYNLTEVIGEIDNQQIREKLEIFVRVMCKVNREKIEYVDMEN